MNPTTFIEGTYGFIRNQLAGGGVDRRHPCTGGILVNDVGEPADEPAGLSAALPECGRRRSALLRLRRAERSEPGLVGRHAGSTCRRRSAGAAAMQGTAGVGDLPGPPNQLFPGFLNINRTQDVAISLTKVCGRAHDARPGFYNNHSFKAQNTGAGGVANLGFQGYVELRQRHQQRPRHRLRLRQRGGRRLHAVPPAGRS